MISFDAINVFEETNYGGNFAKRKIIRYAGIDDESNKEVEELMKSLEEQKKDGSVDFNFFVSLFMIPRGLELYQDCFNMISDMKLSGYKFRRSMVDMNRALFYGEFTFTCGSKEDGTYRKMIINEGKRYGAQDVIKKSIELSLNQIINRERVRAILEDGKAIPLIEEYVERIKARGDTSNGFVAYMNQRAGWKTRGDSINCCVSNISDWLSKQFMQSRNVSEKIKKMIDEVDDTIRSEEYIKERKKAHGKDMAKRIFAILKELPSEAREVIEDAQNQLAIDIVMGA